jgi:hypothetical protein
LIGVIVFICLSPRRSVVMATAGLAFFLTLFVASNLAVLTGNPQLANEVQDRIATFSDLKNDGSADARAEGSASTLRESLEEPLGQGLGFASGAKLSGGNNATAAATYGTENGYLERLLEMGLFGFALYIASIGAAFVASFIWLRGSVATGNPSLTVLYATIVTIQVALIGADLSADHHLSLMAIFYWIAVGLASSMSSELSSRAATGERSRVRGISGPAGAV